MTRRGSVRDEVRASVSRARKAGSPFSAKMRETARPSRCSIRVSRSTKRQPRRCARARPTVLLPEPMKPVSTMRSTGVGAGTPPKSRVFGAGEGMRVWDVSDPLVAGLMLQLLLDVGPYLVAGLLFADEEALGGFGDGFEIAHERSAVRIGREERG